MDVDVGEAGERRVARVHSADVASERRLAAMRVVCVIEVVVPPRVCAKGGIVDLGRQRQRRAAAPAADQLGGEQFPLLIGACVRVKESIEGADPRLVLAKADEGAVASEDVGLRHRQELPGLARVPEDELAGLDRPSLARQRFDAAALDRRLVDAVFVAERVEIARLRAEVLPGQHADTRETLVLLARDRQGALPLFLGIAEGADPDVDLTGAERLFPALRIVDAHVAELPGAGRHPDAERFGEALQRFLWNAERFEAGVADSDRQPRIGLAPPIRRGGNVKGEPADRFPARLRIVDAQEHVRAEVRRRPQPQHGRLDFMQVEHGRGHRHGLR
jgi:hypothetical protein